MPSDWESDNKQTARKLHASDVCDYLIDNPSFLQDHDELLQYILPPTHNRGDKVEDFQRFMLTRLQNHFIAIRGENDDLMDLMQSHLQRQNRINDFVLTLLDTPDFETLLTKTFAAMAEDLEQTGAQIFIEKPPAMKSLDTGAYGSVKLVDEGFINSYLRDADLLMWNKAELQSKNGMEAPHDLFGTKGTKVESIALIRLSLGKGLPQGLLALGSEDPSSYATGLATEQIEFLAAVTEKTLQSLLP